MPLDPNDNTIFTTADGVVLKLKPVSQVLIAARGRDIPIPEPPMIAIEEKDGREEPYYGAPSYLKAMEDYNTRVNDLARISLLYLGTRLVEVPDDFPTPESTGWSEELEDPAVWGQDAMKVPTDVSERYVFWLSYIALARDNDLVEVIAAIRSLGGSVTQLAVLEAMDSFRGSTTGTTDTGVATPNRAARRRDRSSK